VRAGGQTRRRELPFARRQLGQGDESSWRQAQRTSLLPCPFCIPSPSFSPTPSRHYIAPVPNSRVAIYAGSFDPITRGHEDLMHRSLEYVDRLVVAVARNSSKTPLFTVEERVSLIRSALGDEPRIEVRSFDGLLVDFAKQVGASLLIRGLRAVSDFEYEYQMALMNRHLSPRLETVFMMPSLDTTYISASMVREVARYGGDVHDLVHPSVEAALRARIAPPRR
jgi:pantetheine-phosphate adenylyltransferase